MLRKLLCLLVVLSVLLTLPACGRKGSSSAGSTPTQTAPSQTNPTKATEDEQTSPTTIPTETTLPPATKPDPRPETETVPPETQPKPTEPKPTEPAPTVPPVLEPDPTPTYGHTPLSQTEYYQYSQMTTTEKQVYSKLVSALKDLQSEVSVTGITIKADAALTLFHRVIADHPQFFWASRSSSVIYDSRTQNVEKFILLYTDGESSDTVSNNKAVIRADRAKIAAKKMTLEAKISQILGTIPANIPAVEREKRIHDYIVSTVRYDTAAAANPNPVNGFLPHAFDVYGAAIEGKAVCEGYAKLFQYLCYRTGIHATQISGIADGGGHMWNAVKLDGDWYELDATWADLETDAIYYGFFNLSHNEMAQSHAASTEIPYPQATGTKYRYADYYALKLLSATQVSDNYKTVVDRLISASGGYLIIYKNGVTVSGKDMNTLVYSDTSAIAQYAHSRGYRLEFANSYSTYEEFIYVSCTVRKR